VVAPVFDWRNLAAALLAFFLGVGVCAHALDELNGRPLRTPVPGPILWTLAIAALAAAVGLGVLGAAVVSWWLLVFVAFGAFIVLAYNLELFGGAFHSDLWFALSWGDFPALTGYFAQAGVVRPEAVLVAGGCAALAAAQQHLSTPVRLLRRRAREVTGRVTLEDDEAIPLDEATLRAVPEGGPPVPDRSRGAPGSRFGLTPVAGSDVGFAATPARDRSGAPNSPHLHRNDAGQRPFFLPSERRVQLVRRETVRSRDPSVWGSSEAAATRRRTGTVATPR
jgi:hypothetical protein